MNLAPSYSSLILAAIIAGALSVLRVNLLPPFPMLREMKMADTLDVKFAVYGALSSGSPDGTAAANVTQALQAAINASKPFGNVRIDNKSMKGDPCPNADKHFGATVIRNGQDVYFACKEGQTINFLVGN
ncbi:hypothethical protein (plasmid) [Ralstonia solanacearum CMR15]|nr:hypothethical protein [Ralstonia solanacearum CMR15]